MSRQNTINFFIMENENNAEIVKTGEWVLTYLITAIPIVGIVMLFVWAFGSNTNPNKANWAKAALIWVAIIIALYVLIIATFGVAFLSAFR
jgi:heme/copper-type cytochrome/quinol oxidase subunit 2